MSVKESKKIENYHPSDLYSINIRKISNVTQKDDDDYEQALQFEHLKIANTLTNNFSIAVVLPTAVC